MSVGTGLSARQRMDVEKRRKKEAARAEKLRTIPNRFELETIDAIAKEANRHISDGSYSFKVMGPKWLCFLLRMPYYRVSVGDKGFYSIQGASRDKLRIINREVAKLLGARRVKIEPERQRGEYRHTSPLLEVYVW